MMRFLTGPVTGVLFVFLFINEKYAYALPNPRPVVGVLTLPSVQGLPTNASYLPASYVKWLESRCG